MNKYFITDEEFERLNWYDQRNYKWCEQCERFYHIESNHACNTYKVEGVK